MSNSFRKDRNKFRSSLFKTEFQKNVKFCIDKLGGTAETERMTGINARSLLHYMNGEAEPKIFAMVALAQAAGVSLDWLITGEESSIGAAESTSHSSIDPAIIHDVIYISIRSNRIELHPNDTITNFAEEFIEEYERLSIKKHKIFK